MHIAYIQPAECMSFEKHAHNLIRSLNNFLFSQIIGICTAFPLVAGIETGSGSPAPFGDGGTLTCYELVHAERGGGAGASRAGGAGTPRIASPLPAAVGRVARAQHRVAKID